MEGAFPLLPEVIGGTVPVRHAITIAIVIVLCGVFIDAGFAVSLPASQGRCGQGAPCEVRRMAAIQKKSIEDIINHDGSGTEVFQLVENPLVFVVDFSDLVVQASTLNRIALFAESRDKKGTVLTDEELSRYFASKRKKAEQHLHGHNYRADDLARFFNAMGKSGIQLNTDEEFILALLVDNDILKKEKGLYVPVPPYRVLLSVSKAKEGSDRHLSRDARRSIMRHEGSHGEFFTNPVFRRYCYTFWESLSPWERKIFRDELDKMGYDTTSEDLVVNEMQAFLWEPVKGAFIDVFLRFGGSSLTALRHRFLEGIDRSSPKITIFFNDDFIRACKNPLWSCT